MKASCRHHLVFIFALLAFSILFVLPVATEAAAASPDTTEAAAASPDTTEAAAASRDTSDNAGRPLRRRLQIVMMCGLMAPLA